MRKKADTAPRPSATDHRATAVSAAGRPSATASAAANAVASGAAHLSRLASTDSRQLDLFAAEPEAQPADLRTAAHQRLARLWDLCPPGTRKRGQLPSLDFFRRRTDAGRAVLQRGHIELNEDLLERFPEPMLRETIAHELAHVLTWRLFGRRARAHGPEWQAIMRDWFGVEPERTHRFELTGLAVRRQRRWHYRCDCRDHAMSAVRHHRAAAGVDYRCLACQGPLRYVGPQSPRADSEE